jgi:hypothetical protein
VLEVAAVKGDTVTFTTPLHLGVKRASQAQLVRFARDQDGPVAALVHHSGVEDLYVAGGGGGDGGGNIRLDATSYAWVKNVESDRQVGSSVSLSGTFRCVVRDSYLHSTREPNPGGGGYGLSLNQYAADNLVENNVVWNFNKVMVMRTTGGGNVVAYNYMQDGYGAGYPTIVEVGLNAAHMTTPHMELFEGNESFNFDSDSVWGNSVYITVFRNHLTGLRRSAAPLRLADQGNRRAVGLTVNHWWYSFVGNVLGQPEQGPGRFVYEVTRDFAKPPGIPMWQLGYDGTRWTPEPDAKVLATTLRHGNFDYASKQVVWDPGIPGKALPPSLYLQAKPAFLGDAPWPLFDPEREQKVGLLPARARFDAIHGAK